MATYYRGFDDTDGISDFTDVPIVDTATDAAWSVVSTNRLQGTSAAGQAACFAWNDIDSDADRDDVEILGQVYIDSNTTTQRWFSIRTSTSGASRTGYAVRLRTSSFDLYRFTGSTYTSIDTASVTITSGTWCWVRFRINGTTVQARYWADGGSEDTGSWPLEITDSTYSTLGHVGPMKGNNTNTQLWRYFGVGTAGDTAPASAPATTVVKDMIGAGFIAFAR